MDRLQASADYIQNVTESSTISESYDWRLQNIRIAVLDTGIDMANDTLIETAIKEDDRIKESWMTLIHFRILLITKTSTAMEHISPG